MEIFTFGFPEPVMAMLRRLVFVKAPPVLQALVFLLMMTMPVVQWIDCFETFAGQHQVTREHTAAMATHPSPMRSL